VPDAVHSKLKAQAAQCGESLSAYLLGELVLRLRQTEEDEAGMRLPAKSKNGAGKKSQRRSKFEQ
jgi:hypothetical protein